ncbi:Hypothetical protein FNO222_1460 [Francisella orientalis]|uniref:Uncharacterized protein n=1 Tax=Francisella orientalis TaxID=299583 RepID=A0ABN4H8R3_9GAMM|nr:hypothetical protein FNO12_1447 [Francisella orientalis FNO12]AKN87541.1 Hypothetical protein FNO24_1449 [Francisella orientalis FNO24]AKN89079.1 Hypothetical protein FNO190_1447 [Francisella orientalis]AKU05838.1 Hypothetical protein FNO01_1447 [Francisella orientalis]QEN20754.1 Hypothetical protein FNO39_1460 [Francisella orientalis]
MLTDNCNSAIFVGHIHRFVLILILIIPKYLLASKIFDLIFVIIDLTYR